MHLMRSTHHGSLSSPPPREEGFQVSNYIPSILRTRSVSFPNHSLFKYFLLALVFAFFVCVPDFSSGYTTMLISDHQRLRKQGEVKLSLWLLPPEDVASKIQSQIDAFTDRPGASASFVPHVTLVGGITCENSKQLEQFSKALELGLSGFGGVPVRLREAKTQNLWSQALYLPVNSSKEFLMLCQYCREILGMDDDHWEFPKPAGVPHLSLYYGTKNVPLIDEVDQMENFVATRVGLWKTDPSTVEGVEMWRPMAFFDLV